MLLVSWVVMANMIWVGTVAGASPQEAGASTDQAGEVITLKIDGWTCASCEKGIRRALEAVPGVRRADVSYAQGGAIVEVERGRVSQDQLTQAVASAGNILSSYRASVVPNGTLTAKAGEQGGGWNWFENLFK
ncbi:MAG: cation transporter [Nitrospira defluvii]|nr:cation transporter [Nitrospira defluvii]